MKIRTSALLAALWAATLASVACSKDPVAPGGTSAQLTAPAIDAPSDDEQLTTLRPTFVVRNGSSNQNGTRTYEFQVSTSDSFGTMAVSRAGIAENPSGRTSFTPDADLQSTTRFFWRARLTQGGSTSEWSPVGRVRTKAVGFNRPGELFDPLIVPDETVGERFGSTTFVPGRGIKLNDGRAYVRYTLPATVSRGEFSMEIEGIAPNGPIGKPRLFSMLNGTGRLDLSKFQMNVQYRGRQGNPDNCIAFKAVWGDEDVKLEPDLGERHASVMLLDPGRTYFWQASWDALTFRVIVREDSPAGREIYNRSETSPPGYGPYAPVPHYAYLGANELALGGEDGTVPNITIRNVWLSERSRPTGLGSAAYGRR